jgi:hypothetical protein
MNGEGKATVDLIVGSGEGCDLRVDDEYASARHAKITPIGSGRFTIEDLGTTNGTWMRPNAAKGRGAQVYGPTPLRLNWTVIIGRTELPSIALMTSCATTNAIFEVLYAESSPDERAEALAEHLAKRPSVSWTDVIAKSGGVSRGEGDLVSNPVTGDSLGVVVSEETARTNKIIEDRHRVDTP